MKKIIILVSLGLLMYSCKDDAPVPTPQPVSETPKATSRWLYIGCEGNFGQGNAAVTSYNPDNGAVTEDKYMAANNSSVGDVVNHIKRIGDKVYVVVNNSGKIEVCDKVTLTKTATISGFTSPRFILPVSSSKAYVTDLFGNSVSVVNLNNNTITGSIPLSGWTEEMAFVNNKVYVTNISRDYVYVIDPASDVLTDSIQVSRGGGSIVVDKNNKLWVMCSGESWNGIAGALYQINPETKSVEATYSFSSTDYPNKVRINSRGDQIYYINNNIYKMDITDGTLPVVSYVAAGTSNFYGLEVDHEDNSLYVGDAVDYVQKGKVLIYKENGDAIRNIATGISPSSFCFVK